MEQTVRRIDMKHILNIATVAGLLAMVVCTVIGFQMGIFRSQESFQQFIMQCGMFGSLIFVAFQAVQVVIPILPGSLGCVVGILAFGPVWGFVFNYIGICLGSVLAFLLAKRYGQDFVMKVTNPKQYEKYNGWLNKGKRFERFFTAAIVLPVAPDDFLCFLAGLTNMSLKKFTLIIILGKPLALLMYSFALTYGIQAILRFF